MQMFLGIVICAALFAVFGVVRYRGCAGHCAGCTSSCGRHAHEGEDHVG